MIEIIDPIVFKEDNKTMVVSIPASDTITYIKKYGIYECPLRYEDQPNLLFKRRSKYAIFRNGEGGNSDTIFTAKKIIKMDPRNEISSLVNDFSNTLKISEVSRISSYFEEISNRIQNQREEDFPKVIVLYDNLDLINLRRNVTTENQNNAYTTLLPLENLL